MKVLHYSNAFGFKPTHELLSDFGDTVTDTSKWRPELSLIHAQSSSNSGKRLIYDFPDGKDNGETVQTFIRSPSVDVTEIDSALQSSISSAKDKIKADKDKKDAELKKQKETKDYLNQVKETLTDSKTSDSSANSAGE